jgi:hypothetical protein
VRIKERTGRGGRRKGTNQFRREGREEKRRKGRYISLPTVVFYIFPEFARTKGVQFEIRKILFKDCIYMK